MISVHKNNDGRVGHWPFRADFAICAIGELLPLLDKIETERSNASFGKEEAA
jgi:hypothetical protein